LSAGELPDTLRSYTDFSSGRSDFYFRWSIGSTKEICSGSKSIPLHRIWDDLITSSNNTRTLRNMAVELISRFPRAGLTELAAADPNFGLRRAMKLQRRSLTRTARCTELRKRNGKTTVKSPMWRCCRRVMLPSLRRSPTGT